jgi:hypothetical protein
MRNVARVKSVNPNDVEGAVLALVALQITEPEVVKDCDDEYIDKLNEIMQEHFRVFGVPAKIQTPAEGRAVGTLMEATLNKAAKMVKALRTSRDPLFRALAGPRRTAAE